MLNATLGINMVLIDVMMPDVDGYKTMRQIHRSAALMDRFDNL